MSKDKTRKKNDKIEKKNRVCAILAGSVAGLINGLFGGGGGMIVVPTFTLLLKLPPKVSHATAILIILPLSLVSGLFYATFGSLDLSVAIPVIIGVVLGGAVGALLLAKLSSKWVVIIFAVVMAVAGVKMLVF